MSKPTFEQRARKHPRAIQRARVAVDQAERYLAETESDNKEDREQNMLYAVRVLSDALAHLSGALDPVDVAAYSLPRGRS